MSRGRTRRAARALAVAGVATSVVAIPAQAGWGVVVNDSTNNCWAEAVPDGGPALLNGTMYGDGRGDCSARLNDVWTYIEVQHGTGTDTTWYYDAGAHNSTGSTWTSLRPAQLSGCWNYRVATRVYKRRTDGTVFEAVRAVSGISRYGCK
jgi:predicted membrane-bound mannosyltransferase